MVTQHNLTLLGGSPVRSESELDEDIGLAAAAAAETDVGKCGVRRGNRLEGTCSRRRDRYNCSYVVAILLLGSGGIGLQEIDKL